MISRNLSVTAIILIAICVCSSSTLATVRIACVGDSTTFGAGINERVKNCYPAQLGRFLGDGFEVRNFGVNASTMLQAGNKPYWKNSAFAAAKVFAPNVVVIALGTNDSKPENWTAHSQEFAGDYAAMIEEFATLSSKPEIYACLPVPAFPERWGISESVIAGEIIPAIREVAKKQGIGLIDLHSALQGKGELVPDKIHPNAQGAGIMAWTIAASVLSSVAGARVEEGFVPLFDGQTLNGWLNVNCAPSTWRVGDGMIHCSGIPTGALRTTRQYENFVMEVEWRHLKPAGNAGIFIWSGPISAPGVPFLRAIEVQVLDQAYGKSDWFTTHGDVFPIHGSTMMPDPPNKGSRSFPREERSKPSPEWNHYRIVCIDGILKLSVNGKEVSGGQGCDWRKGYLALESEGGEVDYRNLRIRELPSSNAPAEQTAPEAAGHQSLYSGVDLSGWKAANGSGWKPSDWRLAYDGEGGELWSTAEYGDFELIFDWRLPEGAAGLSGFDVLLRGNNGIPVSCRFLEKDTRFVGPLVTASRWRELVAPPGKWNRSIIAMQGNEVSLTVNGHQVVDGIVEVGGLAERGAVGFQPAGGAFELAGIYVRELSDQ